MEDKGQDLRLRISSRLHHIAHDASEAGARVTAWTITEAEDVRAVLGDLRNTRDRLTETIESIERDVLGR